MRRTPIRYVTEREADPEGLGYVALHVEYDNGETEGLLQVVFHSPTGLEYGYGGSGPADMALTILANFYGVDPRVLSAKLRSGSAQEWTESERRVVHYHQDFKFAYVANATW